MLLSSAVALLVSALVKTHDYFNFSNRASLTYAPIVSGLARVRRNVLLIDSGEYRNDPTRHMHDVIGTDGKSSI